MKYDLIIWDFNGTIADDVTIGIEAANVVLSRRGMRTIDSVERYRELFCFPIIKYYEKLGFDFEKEPYEVPADEWTAEYIKRERDITLNEGCLDVLKYVREACVPQIIISSSEAVMLKREVAMLGISEYFESILGKSDNYAHGKIKMAKEWARGKSYNALFIGDSVHDLETANAIGADCILFTGGHDSKEHFKGTDVKTVDSLSEIIDFIK